MFKHLIALVLAVLAGAFVSPAVAQQPPGTSVGTLTCKMAPSIGLIFGSRQRMACRFTPNGPNPPEGYVGVMGTIGLDIRNHGRRRDGVGRVFTHPRPPARRPCRNVCWGKWRDRRRRRRWCQSPVWRNGTFDSLAAAFGRRVGRDKPVPWSFKPHAYLGAIK